MNIIVFGPTGATGRQLLEQALAAGHHVTAFARHPADLAALHHPNLRVVQGDVMHPATVDAAMPGHDAVLVALGPRTRSYNTMLSGGTSNIIWQMHQHGIRRLIVLSTLGVGASRHELGLWQRYVSVPLLRSNQFDQKEKQEEVVRNADLDWIIVRPTQLTNGPRTDRYFAGLSRQNQTGLRSSISRADVAAFMLNQLTTKKWLGRAVLLTGANQLAAPMHKAARPKPQLT